MPEPDLNPVSPAPCPFCGSRMIETSEDFGCAFMACIECGAYGPSAEIGKGKHYDIALALWDARAAFRWMSGSEEPPVTDTRFAVLLISGEEVDFTSDERKTIHFLRPHYPGAKKPVPVDCHWLLLPPIPEGS